MSKQVDTPFLVALNLTRRCNLKCAHCYLDAGMRRNGDPDELNTKEVFKVIYDIAALSDETMVVITGGEPLLRPDILEICSHATKLGLMVVMGTNGTLLTEQRVGELQAAGVQAAGISLDSLKPDYHDDFRGVASSWDQTMAGIDNCRKAGMMFQIHFSVTDDNADELDEMISFARSVGASVLNFFFLVCTGRGETYSNISLEVYEQTLERIAIAAAQESELLIRARCAPHIKRMATELKDDLPITQLDGYEAGGCLAGTRYCRVTPHGRVTPCPYMEAEAGSIRKQDFADIWQTAPLFDQFREPKLEGRCGICEYAKLCGGCRARPYARSGNMMGEDFLCGYQPGGGPVIEPITASGAHVTWSSDAEKRLQRIPAFVRRFVRTRAENHVRELGETIVTPAHLETLAKRRFGNAGPPGFRKPEFLKTGDPGSDKRKSNV